MAWNTKNKRTLTIFSQIIFFLLFQYLCLDFSIPRIHPFMPSCIYASNRARTNLWAVTLNMYFTWQRTEQLLINTELLQYFASIFRIYQHLQFLFTQNNLLLLVVNSCNTTEKWSQLYIYTRLWVILILRFTLSIIDRQWRFFFYLPRSHPIPSYQCLHLKLTLIYIKATSWQYTGGMDNPPGHHGLWAVSGQQSLWWISFGEPSHRCILRVSPPVMIRDKQRH